MLAAVWLVQLVNRGEGVPVTPEVKDVEKEFYENYESDYWPDEISVSGVTINCQTSPMLCFDHQSRQENSESQPTDVS